MASCKTGTLLGSIATLSMISFAAQAANAQQIISAVQSEAVSGDTSDKQIKTTAGVLASTTFGGADNRAISDFGVNKIYASGNEQFKQTSTSAWLDSYTVGGAAGEMVSLNFTINVHGGANVPDVSNGSAYNYKFYALRGNDWTITGSGPTSFETPVSPTNTGDQYDSILLNQVRRDGSFSQLNARDFTGIGNYGPNGNFFSKNSYDVSSDTYTRFAYLGGVLVEQRFSATTYQELVNGVPRFLPLPYTALPPQVAQGRANLESSYQLLGTASFCSFPDDECGTLFTGQAGIDLTLQFSLMAGSTFSLAGYLFADDFTTGTADFFNTARLTGISTSNGASLVSASGTLTSLGNGQFGYQAVQAGAVPEPATWAMMLLGFGAVGHGMRRRRTDRPRNLRVRFGI